MKSVGLSGIEISKIQSVTSMRRPTWPPIYGHTYSVTRTPDGLRIFASIDHAT